MRAAAWALTVALLAPVAAAAAPEVSMAFRFYLHEGPEYASCNVPIEAGWDLWQLLGAATKVCIHSWEYRSGRIECIDEICRSWDIKVNGTSPGDPFWTTTVQGGEQVELIYFGVFLDPRGLGADVKAS